MEDPQYSAFLVQDGVIHINRWTSAIGERKIGIHGQDSVLGSVVFPEYEHVIARACSHLHSTILRLPEESFPRAMRPWFMAWNAFDSFAI